MSSYFFTISLQISEINAAITVTRFIASYNSYRRDKRREDDLAVRRRLMDVAANIRAHLLNAMDNVDWQVAAKIQETIDQVDVLNNELRIAETGHKYPFFSPQKSVKVKALKKLVEYDASLITGMEQAADAARQLEYAAARGDEAGAITTHAGLVRSNITRLREEFKKRIEFIKGIPTGQ